MKNKDDSEISRDATCKGSGTEGLSGPDCSSDKENRTLQTERDLEDSSKMEISDAEKPQTPKRVFAYK